MLVRTGTLALCGAAPLAAAVNPNLSHIQALAKAALGLYDAAPQQEQAMRSVMRSKIHNARVTEANLAYVGSITIDADLIERVGLWPGERVMVVSNTSGARLETYVIEGERGSGAMCMNGAAAHLIGEGEEIIVMGFELTDKPISPKVILVDRNNRFVRWLAEKPSATIDAVPSLTPVL
jgi:aspartate 1-decarboxylase